MARVRFAGGRARRAALAAALFFALTAVSAPQRVIAASPAVERARLPSGDRAALVEKRDIYLEATPKAGEGLIVFARRFTGSPQNTAEVAKANGNPRRLIAGQRYRVPFRLLGAEDQLAVMHALFPDDRAGTDGWLHRTRGETLDKVVEWFASGRGALATVRTENRLGTGRLPPRSTVRIPNSVLRPAFRAGPSKVTAGTKPAPQAQVVAPSSPQPPPAAIMAPGVHGTPASGGPGARPEMPPKPSPGSGEASSAPADNGVSSAPEAAVASASAAPSALTYGEDAKGRYAIYALHAGEALYSGVVIRFTGRLHSDDVRAVASEVAARSGIADVTSIPIGFPVRIPVEYLLPEFLPATDPRRLEYEVERRLSGQYRNVVEARGLEGVTVVVDAGHGGIDVGASMAGVWESLYVYDIALRIKRTLENETRAAVRMTTRDGTAWDIVDRDVLPFSRGHAVLTTPPFPITDTVVGVNLRWYFANSQLRQARASGASADKVVFVSVHADSLHPSLRGATAYIPDAAGTEGKFRKNGAIFTARKEVREQPEVQFSLKERQRSEGLSRELAERVIAAMRSDGLGIHPFNPVRDRIFRGKRPWVPAVLRYNAIPAKLLLEVCNLANLEDRTLLTTRAFRQRVAASVVEGLLEYFRAPH